MATTATPAFANNNTNTSNNRNSLYLKTKAEEIELLLSEPEIDLWKLRKLALTPGGLVNGKCVLCYTILCYAAVSNKIKPIRRKTKRRLLSQYDTSSLS